MAANESPVTVGERFSIKVPPTWDGSRSWYGYERDVREWTGMTTVDPDQRGPLLSAKIIGHQLFIKEYIKQDEDKLHSGRKIPTEEHKNYTYAERWKLENAGVAYVLETIKAKTINLQA